MFEEKMLNSMKGFGEVDEYWVGRRGRVKTIVPISDEF